jgi:hypothetical protein
MESNCAGKFSGDLGAVTRLHYARNLSRVRWLMYGKGDQAGYKRFRSKWLPDREPAAVEDFCQRRADYSWQLEPFWKIPREEADSREQRGIRH